MWVSAALTLVNMVTQALEETPTKPVFSFAIVLKSGVGILTHPCQDLAGAMSAMDVIRATLGKKIKVLHIFSDIPAAADPAT